MVDIIQELDEAVQSLIESRQEYSLVARHRIILLELKIARLRVLLRRCAPQFAITAGEGGLYDEIQDELAKE